MNLLQEFGNIELRRDCAEKLTQKREGAKAQRVEPFFK
jgi:hypothetical protein